MKRLLLAILLLAMLPLGCSVEERWEGWSFFEGVDASDLKVESAEIDEAEIEDAIIESADIESLSYEYYNEIFIAANEMGELGDAPTASNSQAAYVYIFPDDAGVDEKYAHFTVQMPRDYKEGTDVIFSARYSYAVPETGTVCRWHLRVCPTNIDGAIPVGTAYWVLSDAAAGDTLIHHCTPFAAIDGSAWEVSNMLLCYISRDSSDASDTFVGNVVFYGMSMVYQIDSPGSREVWE